MTKNTHQEVDPKLFNRFYHSVGFINGLKLFLFLEGQPPSSENIPRIITYLSDGCWFDRCCWGNTRTTLIKNQILVVTNVHWSKNIYAWNQKNIPLIWTQVLTRVLAGEPITDVVKKIEQEQPNL